MTTSVPRLSIVVARASPDESVLDVLGAMRKQETDESYEVILADRNDDAVVRRVAHAYPEVVLVRAAPRTCLPELRTMGMRRARGRLTVVVGDYCVPEPDWLQSLLRVVERAPDDVVVIGGCVLDGRSRPLADKAVFYFEYGALLPPVVEGVVGQVPGMNTCYKKVAFDGVGDEVLARGFWENSLHPRLLAAGNRLWSSGSIRVKHVRPFPLGWSTRQRFLYSRHFAGTRFRRAVYLRLPAFVVSPLLPAVLLARLVRVMLRHPGHRWRFIACLPVVLWLVGVATIGEMCGYVFGAGSALEEIE